MDSRVLELSHDALPVDSTELAISDGWTDVVCAGGMAGASPWVVIVSSPMMEPRLRSAGALVSRI
jgi:hypothetical protein